MLKKVISGGQTGVDRAGLDAAMKAGIPVGGYCPNGRTAEDGTIPDIYPLEELSSYRYYIRTEKNIVESDGTLIINKGYMTEGTRLTYDLTAKNGKPRLVIYLDDDQVIPPDLVIKWIQAQRITTLNIAGPRESKIPEGIHKEAYSYLEQVFNLLKEDIQHDQSGHR
jgi:hypothetical protein